MKLSCALAAAVLALAACGGGDGDEGGAAEQPPATTEAAATGGGDVAGEAIFAANCAGCHTLEAAGAGGAVGPNLDELQPSAEQVAEQVREGGGRMPSFADQLTDAEIRAVAEYVARSAQG